MRIVIINGHPDARPSRLCAALASAYAQGAAEAGHEVRRIDVGALAFSLIRSREEFESQVQAINIQHAQATIQWAQHLVFVYPLWLGSAPALMKGFMEQVFRYGFALAAPGSGARGGLLGGRTARVLVTMGMPSLLYQLYFHAHGVRAFEGGILGLCGIKPVRHTFFGGVETASTARKTKWLSQIRDLGRAAR